ncbi:MAG: radical SAM protein [Candidatus Njordarchaeia archaeon]
MAPSVLKPFDPWKSPLCTCPRKLTINPYTGCSHRCLYCYITSYIGLKDSTPKQNLLKRLESDMKNVNKSLPVDMSLSSDPYPPIEERLGLTRSVLKVLVENGFKVQITTKGIIYLRDLDIIENYPVVVSETITTLDNDLAQKLEPFAPKPSERLKALEVLSSRGIPFSVRIDPVIPYLNDDEEELRELVRTIANIGAKHVVTSTYKAKPDNFKRMIGAFPELEQKWRKIYYTKGRVAGYAYAPTELRKKLLKPIVEEAQKLGLTYATCREGLTNKAFFNAPTCDGTHLIKLKIEKIHKQNN